MLILLCLLGSSLGAPQSYYLPSYPSYPTAYPTYNTFLGSGSFPRYYGAAAIPRTGFSYSFGPGYNFQWRSQFATTVLFTDIGFLQESWSRSEPFAACNLCTRRQEGARGGRGNPGGDSAEVRTILTPFPLIKSSDTCMHCILTSRFDTRPAPASPESQVLVRQEESPDTATNSETFLLLISCSYSFDPGICQL